MRISLSTFAGHTALWTAIATMFVLLSCMLLYSCHQATEKAQTQAEQVSGRFEEYLNKVQLIVQDISEARQRSIVIHGETGEFGPGIIWSVAHSREAYVDAVAIYSADELRGNTEDTDDWVKREDLHSVDEEPRMELQVVQYPGVSGFVKPVLYVAYPIDSPRKVKQPWKVFLRIGIPRDFISAENMSAEHFSLISPDHRVIADAKTTQIDKEQRTVGKRLQRRKPLRVGHTMLGYVTVSVSLWQPFLISIAICILVTVVVSGIVGWLVKPIHQLTIDIGNFSPIDSTRLKGELAGIADTFNKLRTELKSTMSLAGYGVAQIQGDHYGVGKMPLSDQLESKYRIIHRLSEDTWTIERDSEQVSKVIRQAVTRSFENKFLEQYEKDSSFNFREKVENAIDLAFSGNTGTIERVRSVGPRDINLSLTMQCEVKQEVKSPYLLQAVLESMIDNALKALLPRVGQAPPKPELQIELKTEREAASGGNTQEELIIEIHDSGDPVPDWIGELLLKDMEEFTKVIKHRLGRLRSPDVYSDESEAEEEYVNIPVGVGLFLSNKIVRDIYHGRIEIMKDPMKKVSIIIPLHNEGQKERMQNQ